MDILIYEVNSRIQQYQFSFDPLYLNKCGRNIATTFKLYIKDDLFYIQGEFWMSQENPEYEGNNKEEHNKGYLNLKKP